MKNLNLKAFIISFLVGVAATAGGIKVWATNDVLTSADLNANFAHIHNLMVGSHGARLVNADVSPTAQIAHSKLAAPALVAKAWALVHTTCTTGTCALNTSSGNVTVTFSSTGVYNVARTPAFANTTATVMASTTAGGYCWGAGTGGANIVIRCFAMDGTTPQNGGFQFVIFDNDN